MKSENPENELDTSQSPSQSQMDVRTLQTQIKRLRAVQNIASELGTILELELLQPTIVSLISKLVTCNRVLIYSMDDEGVGLKYGASSSPLPDTADKEALKTAVISVFKADDDPLVQLWMQGKAANVGPTLPETSRVSPLARMVDLKTFYSVPLRVKERLVGVLLVEPQEGAESISEGDRSVLNMAASTLAVVVENARLHSKTVKKLETNVNEMNILQQVDRELNDTIALDHVFRMTLDWALRFTNAQAALLALYDEQDDKLRISVHYGYEFTPDQLESLQSKLDGGITHRVARSGRTEVTPDISLDSDYVMMANNIRSQMSIPVMREDRVVAVMTLESKKLNGFTDDYVEFVQKLATRAAVAIDNARLFTETAREREKLSHILSNIADVVVVIGLDDRVMLINQSALSALRLYPDSDYTGKTVAEVLEHTPLLEIYRRAKGLDEGVIEEVELPNGRVFHTKITHYKGIGHIVVLQDITPFKEMDKLKSELIATVSHDLKQPLSVMTGYLDLLEMKNKFDEQSSNFVNMIDRSIRNMRQLIDDLLDLAKIESGIELKLGAVSIKPVLFECIEAVKPHAESKSMKITTAIPDDLPSIRGEQARLRQIFENLISNAVKYTPPEGEVTIAVESRGLTLRVTVEDNGLGISPEDQAHIFDRFYRVRRPETDSIDGTGLGLAIVKTLVEAHHGKIGLESHLGEGSKFYVTLPTE